MHGRYRPRRMLNVRRGSLPIRRRRPLFESDDLYFEADEALGELGGCAQPHQPSYTRRVTPPLASRGPGAKDCTLPGRKSR